MLHIEDLADLAARYTADLGARVEAFHLGGRRFDGNAAPNLMGVVNLSRDSWYRESVSLTAEAAVRRALTLTAQGAALVDLGAESSLPQAARAGDELQQSLLLPVVRTLAAAGVIVSVETYYPSVARACLEAGAKVINLTGGAQAPAIYDLVAAHDAAVILCHVQGADVRTVGDFDFGADTAEMLRTGFGKAIDQATKAGVRKLWIDPGLGFYYRNLGDSGTRIRHQMRVFLHTFRLRGLGWPTCHALPHAFECFEDDVRCAEPFFAVLAALGRTDLFRTHEATRVRAVLKTLGLWESVTDTPRPAAQ